MEGPHNRFLPDATKTMRARDHAGGRAAAYGLRIDGIPPSTAAVEAAPEAWPLVRVRQSVGEDDPAEPADGRTSTSFPLVTGGRLDLDAGAATAHFRTPGVLSADDLLHPYFAPAAAWFSHWFGRHSFHAGAVVLGGKAYAVLGDKKAGKSSLLAWLSGAGFTVLADDLVVVDGGSVLTGPRCIDLRSATVEALRQARPGVAVRGGSRHRVTLAQTKLEWPLGGWVFLRWGEVTSMSVVPPRDRLARLGGHRAFRVPPLNPADLVTFAALPAWDLARPRGWDLMDEVVGVLSATVGG